MSLSDEQIDEIARKHTWFNGGHAMTNYVAFARDVLASEARSRADDVRRIGPFVVSDGIYEHMGDEYRGSNAVWLWTAPIDANRAMERSDCALDDDGAALRLAADNDLELSFMGDQAEAIDADETARCIEVVDGRNADVYAAARRAIVRCVQARRNAATETKGKQ